MASFACFIQYVHQAQVGSSFGAISRGELTRVLLKNGMSRQEIDEAIQALEELFKARVKEIRPGKLSRQQYALVNAIYGGGLRPDQTRMMEEIATIMEVPVITESEMNQLQSWAQLADTREGSEKALIEEQIRNVLAQKNPDYVGKLNASKISFKVLLSAGFNIMSYVSNQKKILEMYGIQRLRMAKEKGFKALFAPYPLKSYDAYTKEFANAMARGIRGVTEEQGMWKRFQAWLGLVDTSLLGPVATTFGTDINSYSDALEHATKKEQQNKILGAIQKLDRKVARTGKRWLSSIDANAKIRMGEMYYFNEAYDKYKKLNPVWNEAQILQAVTNEMFSITYPDAVVKAKQQFTQWGIVDSNGNVNENSNRFKVRVAEIMREGRDPSTVQKAYETAASKVWQGRMTYPDMKNDPYDLTKFQQRLDSGWGGIIADALNGLRQTASNFAGQSAVMQSLVFSMFGFINGAAAYWQDFMEHNVVFGGSKLMQLLYMRSKDNRGMELTDEQRAYLDDKITEMRGKVMFGLIETATLALIGAAASELCEEMGVRNGPDQGALSITPDKPATSEVNTQMQRAESSLSFCGGRVTIPLEYLGGFSINNAKFIATFSEALRNKDESYVSSVIHAMWLTSSPSITPMMDNNPGTLSRMWEVYQKDAKAGKGYDNLFAVSERELSMAAADMFTRLLPIPNRVVKEGIQVAIPYRTYLPAGIEGNPKETVNNFLSQFALQTVYSMGNATGINQLIQLSTSTDGKIGKPIFDYRHRPINAGNLYDGKSISGLIKPLRDLYAASVDRPLNLYDEKDHFLAVNDVNIPFDSRVYSVLYKDDPTKRRQMSDNEYYNYQYAYTKKFGEWYDRNYSELQSLNPGSDDSPKLAKKKREKIRRTVERKLLDIKRSVIESLEENSKMGLGDLYDRIEVDDVYADELAVEEDEE